MPDSTREYYEERILRVQMYIQKHLDERLTLDDLANVACFSPYHFHRVFSGMVGESLQEYVRRLRLERAAHTLRYSDAPVTDIAFAAGYETHESFTRAFRRMHGQPPKRYRDTLRSGGVSADVSRGYTYVVTINRPGGPDMEVKIQTFEPMTVAFVRHMGPYKECHPAWEKLYSAPSVRASMGPEALCIGISYDNPDITEPEKIRYDACVTVAESFESGNGVGKQVVDGGEYAVLTHKGSYDGLHDCYQWLYCEWLPGSGREAKGAPSLEVYRNSPKDTAPEDLATEIRVPLT